MQTGHQFLFTRRGQPRATPEQYRQQKQHHQLRRECFGGCDTDLHACVQHETDL